MKRKNACKQDELSDEDKVIEEWPIGVDNDEWKQEKVTEEWVRKSRNYIGRKLSSIQAKIIWTLLTNKKNNGQKPKF